MVVTSTLCALLPFIAAAAEQAAPPSAVKATIPPRPIPQEKTVVSREGWRNAMARIPRPKKNACFKSTFPNLRWDEVPCVTPPPDPLPPGHHIVPNTVGNGGANDFAGQVTSGIITSSDGSFDSMPGVTSESGPLGASGTAFANTYSLQLNTNPFSSPTVACAGSPNPGCQGWEQFVYSQTNSGNGSAFIQYWRLRYNTTCPGGWATFMFSGDPDIYCFRNAPGGASVPNQPIANLTDITLTGAASASGDSVAMVAGATMVWAPGINAVGASGGWTASEFNIFGRSGGGEASFNPGSTLVVRTVVHNGTTNAPVCDQQSFTGETNNLTLVGSPGIPIQPSPTIVFTESNIPGSAPGCAAASGIGDTHLTTLSGLYYDFQAAGDFLLLQDGSDFAVQTRQVSGAPTWPNATINKEVAARFGKTRIAVCLGPMRFEVDGRESELNDGQSLSLADGTTVSRSGNTYIAQGRNGDSMRAEVDDPYINVYVGLGHPQTAATHGLLVNPNENKNQIATRTGAILNEPVSFDDLYHVYGDSWRVPAEESILCHAERIERGNPTATFHADNLDPQIRDRAQRICMDAGVKLPVFLDSCTIDVAVTGKETAAKVFVHMAEPGAVGMTSRCKVPDRTGYGKDARCVPDDGRKY